MRAATRLAAAAAVATVAVGAHLLAARWPLYAHVVIVREATTIEYWRPLKAVRLHSPFTTLKSRQIFSLRIDSAAADIFDSEAKRSTRQNVLVELGHADGRKN